jgi:hypothetical protein
MMTKLGVVFLVALGTVGTFSGCTVVHDFGPRHVANEPGTPPWAPAHGHRAKYQYYYYPDSQVYFDVGRSLYFYPAGGTWKTCASLPAGIHIDINARSVLEMDVDRPYLYHSDVQKKHPPGQAKKQKKWR